MCPKQNYSLNWTNVIDIVNISILSELTCCHANISPFDKSMISCDRPLIYWYKGVTITGEGLTIISCHFP